jgi:hypothetical protein
MKRRIVTVVIFLAMLVAVETVVYFGGGFSSYLRAVNYIQKFEVQKNERLDLKRFTTVIAR